MPALHQRVLGLAPGMVEAKHVDYEKGTDIQLTAAEHELEEKCRMKGGTWYTKRLQLPTAHGLLAIRYHGNLER
jgi:hypothetical protein